MPTHDWTGTDVIPNGSGSAVRADLNDALLALFSQNSGNDAPTTTVGYMLWADPDDGYLKIRHGSNSGTWYNLFKLNGEWDPLTLVSGAAGTPSLRFSNSGTNTGLYSPSPFQVGVTTGGGLRAKFSSGEIVFNEILADVDFRVAGTSQPNLFKVDAGTNTVIVTTLNGTTITGTTIQGTIKSGTAVASTSGTSIDFTGIPSWVKRVTVMFSGVSLNGTSSFLFQVGTNAGIVTTGYSGGGMRYGGTDIAAASFTTGLGVNNTTAAATYSGLIIWDNVSGNTWAGSANLGASGGAESGCMGGSSVTLPSTLNRVRITTVNGTNTFDAGTINILYEG